MIFVQNILNKLLDGIIPCLETKFAITDKKATSYMVVTWRRLCKVPFEFVVLNLHF